MSVFGDKRLEARMEELTEQMSAHRQGTLTQVCDDWASLKAGYRFMNNERVTHQEIIATEQATTCQRLEAQSGQVVLAIQDTTSFNFGGRQVEGVGVLDDNRTAGFFAHTTLAVSEIGVPLGILDQQVWSRPPKEATTPDTHQKEPITDKESFKWLQSVESLPRLAQQMITICDREGDIYEYA